MSFRNPRSTSVLVIDSAFGFTLALVSDTDIVTRSERVGTRTDPLRLLDSLMTAAELTLPDVTHVLVRIGIGSYTGLRIGVTFANVFAWSLDRPLASFEDQRARRLHPTELRDHLKSVQWDTAGRFHDWAIPKYGQWSRPKFSDTLE